ncbi:uncharacterized protein [Ambystoma mexicanum]|uniref:uncharacterized protein isoform X3 n=1 Tax=Ambystoma mexicanum TaxID=8296 RepID=UPI0037E73DA5
MTRVLLLVCCWLATSLGQGPDGFLYSTLGESVLFPCERKPLPAPTPPSPKGNQTLPSTSTVPLAPEPEPERPPTQWHFLAPSGDTHPLSGWHPKGWIFKADISRRSRMEMLANASLRLQRLQLVDAGRYICFQSDPLGATTFLQNITLIITGPEIETPMGTSYALQLSLGSLLASKVLILALVIGCAVVFGCRKKPETYVNITE